MESLADFKLTSKPLPQRGKLGGGFLSSLEFFISKEYMEYMEKALLPSFYSLAP